MTKEEVHRVIDWTEENEGHKLSVIYDHSLNLVMAIRCPGIKRRLKKALDFELLEDEIYDMRDETAKAILKLCQT